MRWGWASAVALAAACAVAPGRGELQATVVAVPVSETTWQDADGNLFELQHASIALENLYLHERGNTRAASWSPMGLFVGTAYAHPGHDDSGDVAGELLGSWPIDLLGGETELGQAILFEGALASATLGLADAAVVLQGAVTDPSGTVRPFDFEVWPSQDLTGLPFDAAFSATERPTLHVEVDAAWILSFVDWQADDTDGDGVLTEADADLEALVLFGVHSTGAYGVRVSGA